MVNPNKAIGISAGQLRRFEAKARGIIGDDSFVDSMLRGLPASGKKREAAVWDLLHTELTHGRYAHTGGASASGYVPDAVEQEVAAMIREIRGACL